MQPIFAAFLVLAACGGSPLDPGAGNSLGTGTSTLLVDGTARAHAQIANAKSATDFSTDFEIQVTLNNTPVTTGTVEVKSSKLTTELTYDGQNGGSWNGTAAGYDEAYELNVISGPDKVLGVIVDGPDIHAFTLPALGATLDSTVANDMKWSRAAAADVATFRVGDLDRLTIADSGDFSIPPGSLKADQTQARPNQLTLTRENHVSPKGAVAGSTFSVSVDNELDVVAQPNPAL